MTDTITSEQRSRLMSRIRSRDTQPEFVVRRGLHRLGFRFRLHWRKLPGCPDLVLRRHRACVFVQGCFWHRHPGCRQATTPKSNIAFWHGKFARNVARDRETQARLAALGWRVLVVWECELKADPEGAVARLAARLRPVPLVYGSEATDTGVMLVAEGQDAAAAEIAAAPLVACLVAGDRAAAGRGALAAAAELRIPHGEGVGEEGAGEGGGELPSAGERRVVCSQVTLICVAGELAGEDEQVARLADIYARPWLHVDPSQELSLAAARVRAWLWQWRRAGGLVLHVAGSSDSQAAGVEEQVRRLLVAALG